MDNCSSCKNKDICKWTGDVERLEEIIKNTLIDSTSPVSLSLKCDRYQGISKVACRADARSWSG